jgi:LAO/AO transport system kinase
MLVPSILEISRGNNLHISRALSWAENEHPEIKALLEHMHGDAPIIGITGPPGAGKSTLVNALVNLWAMEGKKVAILAVDPSSAFNMGSLLGDRLRMQALFLKDQVYIRSVSSRGSLGGLSAHIIEMTQVLKHAQFDRIVIETVGVGQSEIEIAGIADTTVVVSVPESGDEIQTLKSGIMEIADIFVVNKSDREGAQSFASYLKNLAHSKSTHTWETPVLLTQADQEIGIAALSDALSKHRLQNTHKDRKVQLFAEKAYKLIQQYRMRDLSIYDLKEHAGEALKTNPNLNLFSFVNSFISQ